MTASRINACDMLLARESTGNATWLNTVNTFSTSSSGSRKAIT